VLRFINGNRVLTVEFKIRDNHTEDGGDRDYSWELTTILDGERNHRRFATDANAFHVFHTMIEAHQSAGFVLGIDGCEVRPVTASFEAFPELEATIDADLRNQNALRILAEAWVSVGDPRGQCVMLDRGQKNLTDPVAFLNQRKASRPAHELRVGVLYGPLGRDGYRVAVKFRHGLVDILQFEHEQHVIGRATGELIELVMANPFARFVRELKVIGSAGAEVVEALAAVKHRALRRLMISTGGTSFDLGGLSNNAPRLEELEIFSDRSLERQPIGWTDLELPHLTRFSLSCEISPSQLVAILDWVSRQRLETVVLSTSGMELQQEPSMLAITKAWLADSTNWPPSLRQFTCDGFKVFR
jgi:hypothetical protein